MMDKKQTPYTSSNVSSANTDSKKGEAKSMMDDAKHQANDTKDKIKDSAKEVADSAKEQFGEGVKDARDNVTGRVSAKFHERKDSIVSQLDSVARAAKQTSDELRSEEHRTAAHYAEQFATQVDSAGQFLRDKEMSDVLASVKDFARRQPTLFLGGAVVLGFLGARFLKSSERGSSQTDDYSSSPGYGTTNYGGELR